MGFMDAVKKVYSNYVNFNGRAGRAEYWWFILFYVLVVIALGIIETAMGMPDLLSSLFALASLLPSLGVAVRRLHDTGHSGWWVLLVLIPLIGFIILIFMSYIKPSVGPNQYGEPAETAPPAAAA